jgi:integrase
MVVRMATPFLHPKSKVYYFRKAVPEHLQPLMGKKEEKFSLHTKDLQLARRLFAQAAADVQARWDHLQKLPLVPEPVREQSMTLERIVALAGEFYHGLLAEHGDNPGPAKLWHDKLDRIQAALPDRLLKPGRKRLPGWAFLPAQAAARIVGAQVREVLDAKGFVPDNESLMRLHVEVASALAQAYAVLARRAEGDFTPDPRGSRFPTWVAPAEENGTDWRKTYAAYVQAREPAAKSIKRQKGVLTAFFAFVGHDDPSHVTRADAQKWMRHRLDAGIAPQTVWYADMAHPRALLNWARRNDYITNRPFDDIEPPAINGEQLRDREFTFEESELILKATFEPVSNRMTIEGAAARRWVPWLCAYSGARVNEVTQARAEDIFQKRSRNKQLIWMMRITPEAGTTKTKKAREVPLHPHLIEMDFLEYVKSRKGKPLFYDPDRARDGSPQNPQYAKAGSRLAEWVRKVVGVTDENVSPNHGWRHLFRSMLLAAEVQEQVIDKIDGHASKTAGQGYGTAWPEVMLAAVSKIPRFLEQPCGHVDDEKDVEQER